MNTISIKTTGVLEPADSRLAAVTDAASLKVPEPIATSTLPALRHPKPGSKTFQLIRLLSAKTGADVIAVGRKLGWQAHTTRAAITGLRKAGYDIAHEKGVDGKPGRYRITAAPGPQEAE